MEFRSVTKENNNNNKKKTAFSSTLNVSIRAHGCALQKGCEPEQPMHVYLAALPTQWDWLSFSHLGRPMKKSHILKLQCLNSVSRGTCGVVGVSSQTQHALRWVGLYYRQEERKEKKYLTLCTCIFDVIDIILWAINIIVVSMILTSANKVRWNNNMSWLGAIRTFPTNAQITNHQRTICQTFLCGNMWPLLAKGKIWQDPEKAITSTNIWKNK